MDTLLVYQRVIGVANYFLENASHLKLDDLKEFDPTVEQLAQDLRALATLLKGLAGDSYDDENMSINAFQCCLTMERIAACVEENNEHDLNELVQQLEMHTKAP